jgi:hypothetical protein
MVPSSSIAIAILLLLLVEALVHGLPLLLLLLGILLLPIPCCPVLPCCAWRFRPLCEQGGLNKFSRYIVNYSKLLKIKTFKYY